jgi:uncharacterized membrane protein
MSHTAQPADETVSGRSYEGVQPTRVTAWAGWIVFAVFMMVLVGMFHAIAGLVALFKDEYFVVRSSGLIINVDYTTWGWIHLLGGVVIAAAGVCLLTGQVWARIVAAVVALVSALINFSFLDARPLWSAIMIAVDVLVIWAVLVHGSEMREA